MRKITPHSVEVTICSFIVTAYSVFLLFKSERAGEFRYNQLSMRNEIHSQYIDVYYDDISMMLKNSEVFLAKKYCSSVDDIRPSGIDFEGGNYLCHVNGLGVLTQEDYYF